MNFKAPQARPKARFDAELAARYLKSMNAPLLFDRQLLRQRQRRAQRLGGDTLLLPYVVSELSDRLDVILREFKTVADIGTAGPLLSRSLSHHSRIGHIIHLSPQVEQGEELLTIAADAEILPFAPQSLDLAVSALTLQHINDLPGLLMQIRRSLRPDGLFMAAALGGDTLQELRQCFAQAETELQGGASPRISPMAGVKEYGALLQRAGFALPVVDREILTVRYSNLMKLFQDLRAAGLTNILAERSRRPLRRSILKRLEQLYQEQFSDPDGKLKATFEIVWLSGWAPHESQQKPLQPGSAKVKLADALNKLSITQ